MHASHGLILTNDCNLALCHESTYVCRLQPLPHPPKNPQTEQKTVKNIGNLARNTLFNFLGREPGKEERTQNQNKLQDSEVH